jgi:hypothetical protein
MSAIIAVAIVLRIVFVWQFVDLNNLNQWEYGEIAKNIVHHNGYSLFYFENDTLEYKYQDGKNPYPSAYMPPGYVLIILPFFFLKNIFIINLLVISLQIICSGLVIYYLKHLCEKLFGKTTAIISIIIYAVLPEFIYAVVSFSPTVVFHLIIIIIIYRLSLQQEKNQLDMVLPLLLTLLIYLRSEFVLFVLLLLLYFTFKKHYARTLIYLLIITGLILPWSIRNSIEFSCFVPFTTNFGQNLYRGNNASDVGWWGDEIMLEKLQRLPRDNSFEIHQNDMYLERAINYIKENPVIFLRNIVRKQFELWVFNLNDPRALNFLYLVPTITILLMFGVGIVNTFNVDKYKFIYLFFLQGAITASIFFALPRYQTMMKILIIPFAATGMILMSNSLKRLFINKNILTK